jgi:hypothetical protein
MSSADLMDGMLRETDYMGLDQSKQLVILLSNTTLHDAHHVLERFSRKGINLRVVEEEM